MNEFWFFFSLFFSFAVIMREKIEREREKKKLADSKSENNNKWNPDEIYFLVNKKYKNANL